MRIGFYDTEVKKSPTEVGWSNYSKLGMSVGCIIEKEITEENDVSQTKNHTFVDDVEGMVNVLNKMDLVVGFNNQHFDDNLICEFAGKDHNFLINNFDILKDLDARTDIKYCTGLDSLAKYTINKSKTEGVDGSEAPKLWQKYVQKGDEGALKKLKSYCMNDCKITAETFMFGLKYDYVLIRPNKNEKLFGNLALKIPVFWKGRIK